MSLPQCRHRYTIDMAEHRTPQRLTIEEYLELEETSSCKHEYVTGELFAFAGETGRHNRIVGNLYGLIWSAIVGSGCELFMENVKVQPHPDVIYYPDLMVVCDPTDDDDLVKHRPCLIVEALSTSTATTDRREKRFFYQQMESLEAFLIIHQDRIRVDRHWRDDNREWRSATLIDGSQLPLPCPPITINVSDIYREIVFRTDRHSRRR
jgi:Uma2 family endonuclease